MKFPILLLAVATLACARADSLDAILGRMDAAARNFKSATANVSQRDYTAAIQDLSDAQNATLTIKRNGANVDALMAFGEPDAHTIVVKGHTAQNYHPKANQVDIYDRIAHYSGMMDQFLLLAFGTSGADLRKNYDVSVGGTEAINGVSTSRLVLLPKSDEVKKAITKIELWIPDGKSNAMQEKVTEPSGNYYLALYSNVKLDANVPDSVFELKLPKNVKKVYPQH